jgi:hypothetical protein
MHAEAGRRQNQAIAIHAGADHGGKAGFLKATWQTGIRFSVVLDGGAAAGPPLRDRPLSGVFRNVHSDTAHDR